MLREFIIALFALSIVAGAAHADPAIQHPKAAGALQRLETGNTLYRQAQNVRTPEERTRLLEAAAFEYETGAKLEPAPIFAYDLGQCYRELGRYTDAIVQFEAFKAASPQTPQYIAIATQKIDEMQTELSRRAMTAPPTGDAKDAAAGSATTAPVQPVVTSSVPKSLPVIAPREREHWYHDTVGDALAVTGIATAVVGGYLLLDASNMYNEADDTLDQAKQATLRDNAHTRELLGVVVVGFGALALVGGVVKFALRQDATASSTTSIAVSPTGITIFGRF